MENIYRSWIEFNKKQGYSLGVANSEKLLKASEKSAKAWNTGSYPSGEAWKYVKFDQLPNTEFRWPSLDEPTKMLADDECITLKIQNFGSPQKLNLTQLPDGVRIVPEVECNEMFRTESLLNSDNPFDHFSQSFFGLGFKVVIDESVQVEKPIRFLFDYDDLNEKDLLLIQNISIELGVNAQADFFVEVSGAKMCGLSNISINCKISNLAKMKMYLKENGGTTSHFIMNVSAEVAEEALFQCFDATLPSKWSRHNILVNLNAPKSEGRLFGMYLNNDENFVDHHTSISHLVGNTESKEDYRGILADSAQAVFNGKIFIAEKASGSNSEQINKNLMLSNKAEVDTKPELQIYNDDVKAAHGATVGQMDEEQRFYLLSRGYSYKQAERVLAKAFVYGLLENESQLAKKFYEQDLETTLSRLGNQ